jgi:hypothetical protein
MKVCVIPMTRQGFRKGERIVPELRMVTERAVHEQWTAAEAARELDSRINRILAKRRWMPAWEVGDTS